MANIHLFAKNTPDLHPYGLALQAKRINTPSNPLPSFPQGSVSKASKNEHNAIFLEENPVEISPKQQQFHTFGPKPIAYNNYNPPDKCIPKEHRPISPSRTSSTHTFDPEQYSPHTESTNMSTQIDEQKTHRLKSAREQSPDRKPSAHTNSQKTLDKNGRSKTPHVINLRRSSPSREKNSTSREKTSTTPRNPTASDSFVSSSPLKGQYTGGSSRIYFENRAAQIMQTAAQTSRRNNTTGASSPSPRRSLSGSRLGTSPVKNIHTQPPITKHPQSKTLQKMKVEDKTGDAAERETKTGLKIVRVILNDALDEKMQFKELINDLKMAIKAEKDYLAQKCENIKVLANCMQHLDKNNSNLDKKTIGAQGLANRTADEVYQMQNDLYRLNDDSKRMEKQIQIERDLVNFLTIKTKDLKVLTLEQMKERDFIKEETERSRREKNKAIEKYQESSKTQSRFMYNIQSQFQKFAKEN